jgi:hypothetical protein
MVLGVLEAMDFSTTRWVETWPAERRDLVPAGRRRHIPTYKNARNRSPGPPAFICMEVRVKSEAAATV